MDTTSVMETRSGSRRSGRRRRRAGQAAGARASCTGARLPRPAGRPFRTRSLAPSSGPRVSSYSPRAAPITPTIPPVPDGSFRPAEARRRSGFRSDWLFSDQPNPGTVVFAGYGSSFGNDEFFRPRAVGGRLLREAQLPVPDVAAGSVPGFAAGRRGAGRRCPREPGGAGARRRAPPPPWPDDGAPCRRAAPQDILGGASRPSGIPGSP
jgi:hypothetical protein